MKYYNKVNYSINTYEDAKTEYHCLYKKTGKAFNDVYAEVRDNTIVTLYVAQNQKPQVMLMPNTFNKCSEEPYMRELFFDNVAVISLDHASKRPNGVVCFKDEKPMVIEGAFIIVGVKDDHVVSLTKEQIDKFLKMNILVPQCIGF